MEETSGKGAGVCILYRFQPRGWERAGGTKPPQSSLCGAARFPFWFPSIGRLIAQLPGDFRSRAPGDMVRIFVPSPTAALDLQLLRRSLQQKLQAASSRLGREKWSHVGAAGRLEPNPGVNMELVIVYPQTNLPSCPQ